VDIPSTSSAVNETSHIDEEDHKGLTNVLIFFSACNDLRLHIYPFHILPFTFLLLLLFLFLLLIVIQFHIKMISYVLICDFYN